MSYSAYGQGFREVAHYPSPNYNVFGLRTGPEHATPTFIDIDGDQDLDLFVGQEGGLISYFENGGTSTEPSYESPVINPFGIMDNFDHSSPVFVDIDDDGDYDLLVGTVGALTIKFFFYTNVGTRLSPQFVRSDDLSPFDLSEVTTFMKPTFGDLDNDGDNDVLVGYDKGFWYAENIGTLSSPLFAEAIRDPFGLPSFTTIVEMSPRLFDFDSDGDLDIITGRSAGNITVYYNFGEPETPVFNENSSKLLLRSYEGRTAPALGDVDNDGDIDMLVAYATGARNLRWHMGTDADPIYFLDSDVTPFNIEDVGNNAKPEFVDLDYDGDLDILIGDQSGDLTFQRNIGTHQNPSFDTVQVNPYGLVNLSTNASPAFVDFRGDGTSDLFIGTATGEFWEFENIGGIFGTSYVLRGVNTRGTEDVGDYNNPAFVPLEGSREFDLFAGEFNGDIKYLENVGSVLDPSFNPPINNPFGISDIGLLATPEFVDIDNDLDYDLVVGGGGGRIHYFQNNGSRFTPDFGPREISPFGLTTLGVLSHPAAGDIDNDGDVDLLVGNGLGRTRLFENKPCKSSFPINHVSGQQQLYQSKEVITSKARIGAVHDMTFIGTEGLELLAGFEVVEGAIFQGVAGDCINN